VTALTTLLSQLLVAYTIEFDNEFEHRMPHRTAASRTAGLAPRGPWLVSLAMWSNFMKYLGPDGITVGELQRRSGMAKIDTDGMSRWGYIALDGNSMSATPSGRRAQGIWRDLGDVVEERWSARFGPDAVDELRTSLAEADARLGLAALPDYLPTIGYGLWTKEKTLPGGKVDAVPATRLSVLLSHVLQSIALDFEKASPVSLALSANVLRPLGGESVRVRDLPITAGIAREITDTSLALLEKQHLAVVETIARNRVARLTPRGLAAQHESEVRLASAEESLGDTTRLRAALEHILADPRFAETLAPYPDGWRAQPPYLAQTDAARAAPREVLPRFPIVTHRGGYPDGS
jgi:hypothetical protein